MVHGIALVAVESFVLMDFIHQQQIQFPFAELLNIAGQGNFAITKGVFNHAAMPVLQFVQGDGLTFVGVAADESLAFGV
jgi:hypothetical protein